MLKVFGNFDRARINHASERDKLRRFSPAAQLRSSTLGIIFVHFVAKNCIGLFLLSSND
jgi:hypothetical protein